MPVVHLGCMHQQLFEPPADVADGSNSAELGFSHHFHFALTAAQRQASWIGSGGPQSEVGAIR